MATRRDDPIEDLAERVAWCTCVAANLMRRRPWLRGQDPEGFAHLVIARKPEVTDPQYLYVLLNRSVTDATRYARVRERFEAFTGLDVDSPYADVRPQAAFDGVDSRLDFASLVDHAAPPYDAALRLYFGQGLTFAESGRRMGVCENVAYNRVRRGIRQVRIALERSPA